MMSIIWWVPSGQETITDKRNGPATGLLLLRGSIISLYTLWQSFPCQLIFQYWGPCDIRPTPHIKKNTLNVSWRDTSRVHIPVVTVLCEGDRQKILIHQVFNRSVKVWDRYEGLSCSLPSSIYLTLEPPTRFFSKPYGGYFYLQKKSL